MTVNQAEQGVENSFPNDFADMQRYIREQRTHIQPVGSDNLKIGGIPNAGAFLLGPYTIGANSRTTFRFNFSPTVPNTTLWNFLWTAYIDVYDGAHVIPDGSALTSGQFISRVMARDDVASFFTNRAIAGHSLVITIENPDTASHNYYMAVYALIPLASGSPIA